MSALTSRVLHALSMVVMLVVTRSLIATPPARNRKNTAAASVEPTTAPTRKETSQGKPRR